VLLLEAIHVACKINGMWFFFLFFFFLFPYTKLMTNRDVNSKQHVELDWSLNFVLEDNLFRLIWYDGNKNRRRKKKDWWEQHACTFLFSIKSNLYCQRWVVTSSSSLSLSSLLFSSSIHFLPFSAPSDTSLIPVFFLFNA